MHGAAIFKKMYAICAMRKIQFYELFKVLAATFFLHEKPFLFFASGGRFNIENARLFSFCFFILDRQPIFYNDFISVGSASKHYTVYPPIQLIRNNFRNLNSNFFRRFLHFSPFKCCLLSKIAS